MPRIAAETPEFTPGPSGQGPTRGRRHVRGAVRGSTALVGLGGAAVAMCLSLTPVGAQVFDWAPNGDLNGGDGHWNTTTPNWRDDIGPTFGVPYVDGARADFFDGNGGTNLVTITGTVAPDEIRFDTNGFIVTGGPLDVGGPDGDALVIQVNSGQSATIRSDFVGIGDLSSTFDGTLVLDNVDIGIDGRFAVAGVSDVDIIGTMTTSNDVVLAGAFDGDVTNTGTLTVTGTDATDIDSFTNAGVGIVNIASGATLEADTVANASGTINVSGGGTLAALSNTITNDDTINLTDGTLSDAGTITNNGTINVSGTSRIESTTDDRIVNSATGVIDQSAGDLTIDGNVQNAGELTFAGTSVDGAGDTVTSNDAANAELNVEAGTVTFDLVNNIAGDVTVDAGATLSADVTSASGDVDNEGTIDGNVTITGGDLDNEGTLAGAGNTLDLQGGTADNSGTVEGAVTVSGGTFDNTGTLEGTVTVTGGDFTNETGGDVQDSLTVNGTGVTVVNETGATLVDVILTEGTLDNAGDVGGAVGVAANGALINEGTVDVTGAGFTSAGAVTNRVGATILGDSDLTVTGGTFDTEGLVDLGGTGTALVLSGTAAMTMGAPGSVDGDVDVAAAGASLSGGGTITGSLTNSGDVTVGAGETLTAADVANTAGRAVTVSAAGTLATSTGPIDNDGTISVGTGGSVTDAGALDNDGTIAFTGASGTGTLASNGGDLANDGTIALSGGGSLNVTGTIVGDGDVTVDGGGTLTGSGDITLTGGGALEVVDGTARFGTVTNSSGAIDIQANGTLEATAIDSSSAFGNAGTVDAPVAVNGDTFTNTGEVDGDVAVAAAGTLANTGGTVDGAVTTDGTVTNTGTVAGGLTVNAGTTDNAGIVEGVVTVTGGSFDNTAGGTLEDGLSVTGGVATNDGGSIARDVTVSGGSFANAAGTVGGELTVTGGTASNAGTLTGSVLVGAGTGFTNTGTLSDRLTSEGTTLNDSGGIVERDVTVADGTTTNRGAFRDDVTVQMDGTLANEGGSIDGNLTVEAMGNVAVGAGGLSGIDTLQNTGTIAIGAGETLSAQIIENETAGPDVGTITIGAGATLQGLANTLTNDGTIDVATDGTVTDAGTITNSALGTITFNGPGGTGTLASTTAGTIVNAGALNVNDGALDITGEVTNSGSFTIDTGAADLVDGEGLIVTSTGRLDLVAGLAAFDSVANNGGDVDIAAGTVLTAPVTSSGTLANAGTIDGTVESAGTTTNTGGTITGALTVTGGTTTNTGDVDGLATVNAGATLDNATGDLNAGLSNAGTTTSGGTITGAVGNTGTLTTTGTITGDVTTSGTMNAEGTLTGALGNSGLFNATDSLTGITGLTNAAGGTIDIQAGTTDVAGAFTNALAGTVTVDSGATLDTIAVSVASNSGDITVAGTLILDELANTADGTLTSTGTITGGLFNEGTAELEGTLAGDLTNRGTIRVTDSLTGMEDLANDAGGTIDIEAGTTDVATAFGNDAGGTVTVDAGATLDTAAVATATNSGDITVDGTFTYDGLTNDGTLTSTGTLDGSVLTNTGTASVGGTLDGEVSNSGTFTTTGNVTGIDLFTNLAAGAFAVGDGHSVDLAAGPGAGLVNAGRTTLGAGASLGSVGALLANTGTIDLGAGATLTGTTTSSGRINVDGAGATHAGDLTNPAGGVIVIADGLTGTALTVDGDFANAGRLRFAGTGTNRSVNVTGAMTGSGEVTMATNFGGGAARGATSISAGDASGSDFTINLPQSQNTGGAVIGGDITLIEAGGGGDIDFRLGDTSALAALEGAPVTYIVTNNAAGDVVLQSTANTGAAAALAGNLVLTQTIASTIVNRPNSPAVDTLYYEDEDNCSPGSWARAQGGNVQATAGTTNIDTGQTVEDEASAFYYGIQGGADFGCYEAFDGGWDITGGVFFGFNTGSSEQDIQSLVPSKTGGVALRRTGTLHSDFDQFSVGAYLAFGKGQFVGDLQVRYDETRFTFTDDPIGDAAGLGLDEEKASAVSTTVAGSLSYFFAIEQLQLSVVPTVGFAYTRSGSTTVDFDGGASLRAEAYETELGFVGLTVGRSQVSEDGSSGFGYSLSTTVYNDFASKREATFRSGGGSQRLESENLGTFGEVSLGVAYLKLLGDSGPGAARQFQAGMRADYRFSEDLEGFGVTGFLRLQF